MTLADFLKRAIETLKNVGIDNPQLDARILACHALGIDRAELLSQSQRPLSEYEVQSLTTLIARRVEHESVARIVGKREFWGLGFGLNEATLEPRPDSESLIEAVLTLAPRTTQRILDLGTGTGCLLLSLLHELPDATGLGVDIAPRAVDQATRNAATLGLDQRAAFCTGNWLDGINEKFDIIVSNPPYIPAPEIPSLMRDVRDHDPMLALDGGADGLAPYRLLIPLLADFLTPNGIAAFEFGQHQASDVANLFKANKFARIKVRKDLAGIERCITATRSAP
jgi:release factor glutamine methyltransferase